MKKNILYESPKSRFESVKDAFEYTLFRTLNYLKNRHKRNGRANLAVYSFELQSNIIAIEGMYERNDLEVFFKYLSKSMPKKFFNGICLDIGANIGNHSTYFADFFSKIYSFEINPQYLALLKINALIKKNIIVINKGVSDENLTYHLKLDDLDIDNWELAPGGNDSFLNVEMTKLDEMDFDFQPISLIKLDIEGMEFKALQGAINTIKKNRPIIIFEQHIDDFGPEGSPVIGLLKEYGYDKFAILEKSPKFANLKPFALRAFVVFLSRLIIGTSTKIKLQNTIPPGFYYFIAAIP